MSYFYSAFCLILLLWCIWDTGGYRRKFIDRHVIQSEWRGWVYAFAFTIIVQIAFLGFIYSVSGCISPAHTTTHTPAYSETGKQDSGIIAVQDGQFVVTPGFRADYFTMLDTYRVKLQSLAEWPIDQQDGWMDNGGGNWLCRADVMARNNQMREWQRNGE